MPMSGEEFVEWLDRELEPLRREAASSLYFDAWCSGKLSKKQVFELMKQRYAYLRNSAYHCCLDRALSVRRSAAEIY